MIPENGIEAFSDDSYDYYELLVDMAGIVPKGAIFVHDPDDSVNGSIANGCLKLCWTQDGSCYRGSRTNGVSGNSIILHTSFIDSPWFKLVQKKKEKDVTGYLAEFKEDAQESLKTLENKAYSYLYDGDLTKEGFDGIQEFLDNISHQIDVY